MISFMSQNRKNSRLYSLLIVTGIFVLSCASRPASIKKSQLSPQQIQQLEMGKQFMINENFSKAAQIYDSLSLALKNSSAQVLALYNAGVAHRSDGKCRESLDRFRSLLQKSFKKFTNFKAHALLEISFSYECLGQQDLSLSSLKDLEKFLLELPVATREILYPARLALAWAKNSDSEQAQAYQSLSLNKIIDYQKSFSNKEKLNKDLSRLFYLMGKSFETKEALKAESFIPSFFYHQLFLLQAWFLDHKPWSQTAQTELTQLFDKLSYTLSQSPNPQEYKKTVEKALKAGSVMIQNEKKPSWRAFYNKQSQKIKPLLSEK